MNKITGITESGQIVGKKNSQKVDDPALFQKTLEDAMGVKNCKQSESITSGDVLGEIHSIAPPIIEHSSMSVGKQTEKLLDQLDQYIKNLGDPNKTLKEIEPSVRDMKSFADSLMGNISVKEGIQDNKLKDIVERSAMMANIEYVKFNRGDYL
jgi:hypothetical protein